MIWFSASCNSTSLPNSLGLPDFPLRMISVCGSNRRTSLSGNWVRPANTRALVCLTTRRTCSATVSNCSPSPRTPRRRGAGRVSTSCNPRRESLRICRVNRSCCPYSRWRFSSPSVPLCRKASPMAITFLVTLRIRLRTFRFRPPTFCSICFMVPRQPPRPIVQQSTVGRVVNVTLHHRRVHPHLSPLNHTPLLGQGHNPIRQLTDSLRPARLSQTHQRLAVRHLLPTDPAEAAIHHILPYFPFQRFVTPVAHVLQNQHAQGHFRRRWLPTPKPTLRMPLSLGFVHRIHQLLIF